MKRSRLLMVVFVIAILIGLAFGVTGVSMLTEPKAAPAHGTHYNVCMHILNPTPFPGKDGTPIPLEQWVIKVAHSWNEAVWLIKQDEQNFYMEPGMTCPRT